MATFYLLPPRACLEESLAGVLGQLLPGLPLPAEAWDTVAERLGTAAVWPADTFLIPRDDLPEGEALADALAAGFGAEPGDRVIEVFPGRGPRSWVLGPADVSVAAAAR